jgi:hypothetical protein
MVTVEVHLYGKLRKYTQNLDPRKKSVETIELQGGSTIGDSLEELGIPLDEVGSNIFLNGEYSSLDRAIQEDSRLGVFPKDMNLLYKWHFRKKNE